MSFTTRPTVSGCGGAVSAGHYLAAQAGAQILSDGGNAADAACAMGFALQVLEPTQNGMGGEVPILVHHAGEDRTWALSGQGPAPAGATIEALLALGVKMIPPDGFLPATVPAALDAWCRLLEQFGTRRLADVLAPARKLAENGYPMYPLLRGLVNMIASRFETDWPTSAAVYLPVRAIGERQTNPALAGFFGDLVAAERGASGGREAGIRAGRDHFYRGRPAEQIEAFLRSPVADANGDRHPGLLTADDLASYRGSCEEPVSVDYRGSRVWKCPPWSQGPVFLQQLRLLEGFDLAEMGPGSADAVHVWTECAKLAFADRDACYGDPTFAEVPLDELLSRAYADRRRKRVDRAAASTEHRPGLGRLPDDWPAHAAVQEAETLEPQALAARSDTTQLVAADKWGNLVSATPSGGWILTSPVVPELGFPVGTRMQMASLDPAHPNALAPGKRPRTTLSPSMALLPDGRRLAFGTPGGDQQDQWTVQFLLQLVDFGVTDLQEAIEAPTVHSLHMQSSFFPHGSRPAALAVESRFDPEEIEALEARGHRIRPSGPWQHGRVLAAAVGSDIDPCEAAASPRSKVAYAIAVP